MPARREFLVIGAGPAGLTAAHELAARGVSPLVIERADQVGGLARTEVYRGYRFDIGGHRFYTKIEQVQQLWERMLGEDFVEVRRLSRIYYRGRFFRYPLEFFDALGNAGVAEGARVFGSYLKARFRPLPAEETLEQWVINRFGRRLYETFFKGYTEKVWGIPCSKIRADWAAQRIRGLSLTTALRDALIGSGGIKTLVKKFHYPVLGPGMMWERFREVVEQMGGRVRLQTDAARLCRQGNRVRRVEVRSGEEASGVEVEQVISTMPLGTLIARLEGVPPEVTRAAQALKHRAFILVGLIVGRAELFPDNWIYIHDPRVKVGRIQNFKNWSPRMVPDPAKTSLGMEYFCSVGDSLWDTPDRELVRLAAGELERLGLARAEQVEDGVVIREAHAYPVYDQGYQQNLRVIRDFLGGIENLQTIGRSGMHRYNNQDHSMLMGMLSAGNLFGQGGDLWDANVERSYQEEFSTA